MSNDFLWLEGFDYYIDASTASTPGGVPSVYQISGSGECDIETGRLGSGQSLRLGDITGGTRQLQRDLPETTSTFALGIACRNQTDGQSNFLRLETAGGESVHLQLEQSGSGGLRVLAGGVSLGIISNVWPNSTDWKYIEVVGEIHPSAGFIDVWVGGTKVLAFEGDTSGSASNHTIGQVIIRCPDGTGGSNWWWFDDCYLNKNAVRLGEAVITYEPVSADTAQADFTPSTGTDNYAMLDEIPVSTTDYVTGTTLGDQDIYDLPNLADDGTEILAVQPILFASKTDAGDREIDAQIISGAASAASTRAPSSAGGLLFFDTIEQDPDTAAAWTISGFNAAQLGVEITL